MECVNFASLDIESIKKRLLPESLQASSTVAGHLISLSTGRRTSVASGCQSPETPLVLTRYCRGPNAEDPNALDGLSVATATRAFARVMPPLLKLKIVAKDSSAVATSTLSSRENTAGDCVRNENCSVASCGSSPGSASWILLLSIDGDDCTFLLIRTTRGRGASIAAATGNTRPSLSWIFAAAACCGLSDAAAAASTSSTIIGSSSLPPLVESSPGMNTTLPIDRLATSSSRLPLRMPWPSPAWMLKPSNLPASEKAWIEIGCGSLTPYCVTMSVIAPGRASCSGRDRKSTRLNSSHVA